MCHLLCKAVPVVNAFVCVFEENATILFLQRLFVNCLNQKRRLGLGLGLLPFLTQSTGKSERSHN